MKTFVNPPRTPVTKGSSGVAAATLPNVCKMPGPPAPFVPAPLPNIAQSSSSLSGATKKVKVEGKAVAIKGCTFKSKGDMASKGTGGGLLSATTHNVAKFVAPGSMDVKFEGKNVQLLGDACTNNNSNPANSATIAELQAAGTPSDIDAALQKIAEECNKQVNDTHNTAKGRPAGTKPSGKECTALGTKKHKCCEESIKEADNPQVKSEVPYGKRGGLLSESVVGKAFSRANQAYNAAKSSGLATKGVWAASFFGGGPGAPHLKADVVILNAGETKPLKKNIKEVVDFKFNCAKKGKMSAKQTRKYKKALGQTPSIIHAR